LLQVIPELETGGAEQTALDISAAVVRAGGRSMVASRGGRMNARLAEAGGQLLKLDLKTKNPIKIIANGLAMATLIKREQVSLIHARSRAPAVSALIAAKLAKVPFLATYHGVYNARSGLKRFYNSIMTRGALTIANSDYTRAHVIAEHGVAPEKVIAIARGVDLTRFDPELVSAERVAAQRAKWGLEADEKRLVLLLAGRLTRWKGQRLLIDAMASLKSAGQGEVILILAGDTQGRDGYREELIAAAKAAGLEEAVRLVGHCDDMPAAYLACDAAATPSLEPEAFGRTAVEPQIMSRPVLASDHGAFRETVIEGETGLLLAPGNVTAWQAGLAKLLALSPKARADMGAAGRERAVRLFGVEAMTAATLAVYERLVGSAT
jgi:glycosyltransferase involved in cell wall biosynthesis